jgi:hypothetical protein
MFKLADMVDVDVLSDGFEIPVFYRRGDQGWCSTRAAGTNVMNTSATNYFGSRVRRERIICANAGFQY